MSEKLPRVPLNVPKLARLVKLNCAFGSANCGSFVRLFTSQRISNLALSVILNSFESDTCVHRRPGPSNVFRPSVPGVNAAGICECVEAEVTILRADRKSVRTDVPVFRLSLRVRQDLIRTESSIRQVIHGTSCECHGHRRSGLIRLCPCAVPSTEEPIFPSAAAHPSPTLAERKVPGKHADSPVLDIVVRSRFLKTAIVESHAAGRSIIIGIVDRLAEGVKDVEGYPAE